jgi:hypothetical protein
VIQIPAPNAAPDGFLEGNLLATTVRRRKKERATKKKGRASATKVKRSDPFHRRRSTSAIKRIGLAIVWAARSTF